MLTRILGCSKGIRRMVAWKTEPSAAALRLAPSETGQGPTSQFGLWALAGRLTRQTAWAFILALTTSTTLLTLARRRIIASNTMSDCSHLGHFDYIQAPRLSQSVHREECTQCFDNQVSIIEILRPIDGFTCHIGRPTGSRSMLVMFQWRMSWTRASSCPDAHAEVRAWVHTER